MTTVRLTGTLTAKSPIFITRPGQEGNTLTMNVVRNDAVERVYTIPGETIKGLLRQTAYSLCVDAAKQEGDLKVSLSAFYRQTAGGVAFSGDKTGIGEDVALRLKEPLLSLFGSATPRLTGRLNVGQAIAKPADGLDPNSGTGLPSGTRRDALTTNPNLSSIIAAEDKELWSRRAILTSEASEAGHEVESAQKMLNRALAKKLDNAIIEELRSNLAAAEKAYETIKKSPDYEHSVQRPLPTKPATPAGTVFEHSLQVTNATAEELGLFFATLQLWNLTARIGGGSTTGYGMVHGEYTIERLDSPGLARDATWVEAGKLTIGNAAEFLITEDPTIKEAIAAWQVLETALTTKTAIFA
jgi:CRISPR type IV-associated protein Csf2